MSKAFIWTQEYSVNVAKIDEQHKEFLEICNNLLDLLDSEAFTNEGALTSIGRLGDYASYHLGTEEEFFIETKYPDASPHIEAHNQFRAKTKYFTKQVRDKNIDPREIVKEVANFAGDWLLDHILNMDKKYSKWFNDHGINGKN